VQQNSCELNASQSGHDLLLPSAARWLVIFFHGREIVHSDMGTDAMTRRVGNVRGRNQHSSGGAADDAPAYWRRWSLTRGNGRHVELFVGDGR